MRSWDKEGEGKITLHIDTIVGMIPATGWYAAYVSEGDTLFFEPVIAWVCTADGFVTGRIICEGGVGEDPSNGTNFAGYVREEERNDVGVQRDLIANGSARVLAFKQPPVGDEAS